MSNYLASSLEYCARLLAGGEADPGFSAEELAVCSDEQGIAGLLLDVAALAHPPFVQQRQALQRVAKEQAAREMAQSLEARRVLDLFEKAEIHGLVLKGTALAQWLYSEPWHRPRCDLDFLVGDAQVAHSAIAVLRSAGYNLIAGMGPETTDGYEVALQRSGGLVIDLHWRLLNNAFLAQNVNYEELASESLAIPSLHPQGRGLGRVHALVHAALHRVTNMPNHQQDRLIWLYDIHLLAGGCTPEEWSQLSQICRDKQMAMPCLDGLCASRRLLGTVIPPSVEGELAAQAKRETWQLSGVDQGVLDRAHFAALSWSAKGRWVLNKFLPPREFMRYRYGSNGRASLAKAYLGRWWTGLRRACGW